DIVSYLTVLEHIILTTTIQPWKHVLDYGIFTYLLENQHCIKSNKEPVMIDGNTNITIEHIFPQNPDPKWKIELGSDDYNYIKENYLNTIGNLTLSGNNGRLGNKSFIDKRDLYNAGYKDSRLWLNKYLAKLDKWGKTEIEDRFNLIAERVLKIWDIPNTQFDEQSDSNEVNIFDAEDPKFKKLEYAIFFDRKIAVNQVAKLYSEVFKQLFELQPETFFNTELGSKIGLTKKPIDANIRQAVAINETYFIEGNIDNIGKFDKIKLALTIFGFEDELMIKYADEK
ncbi:HNH endonuclease family protein, partial [Arundinibacter roseus]